jgi:hypothetical protein
MSEFETSLVYRVSSRTARATQRNPVLKPKKKKQKTKKKNQMLYLYRRLERLLRNSKYPRTVHYIDVRL